MTFVRHGMRAWRGDGYRGGLEAGPQTVTERRQHQPDDDEASQRMLHLARLQGDAYIDALGYLREQVATASPERRAGGYWIGYIVQPADDERERDADRAASSAARGIVRIGVTIRDAADGRFVPGLDVTVTITDAEGREVGSHDHPLTWDVVAHHYAHEWAVPPGRAAMRVVISLPSADRQDDAHLGRFDACTAIEFSDVMIPGEGTL